MAAYLNPTTGMYGSWMVDDIQFSDKFQALLHSTKTNKPVVFNYNNDVWKKFNKKLLGKYPLNALYKERATRLRDTYDYLVLYYSGGVDSNNILRTFIDNDIKIDEICVKWPKPFIDGKFYTPNKFDTSASNYWSEWNYVIRPVLELIAKKRPEIKISIVDFMGDNVDSINMGEMFDKYNFVRPGALLFTSGNQSDNQRRVFDKDKKIAHIYGIDKPILVRKKNSINMRFSDICFYQAYQDNTYNATSIPFYWDPNFPILAYEMAHQMSLHFISSRENLNFLWPNKQISDIERHAINQYHTDVARTVLYTNWDDRFQTNKPGGDSLSTDKYAWFYTSNELKTVRDSFFDELNQRLSLLNPDLLSNSNSGTHKVYKTSLSPLFHVMDIPKELL